MGIPADEEITSHLRRAVTLVAVFNFSYFIIEFTVAILIGSVSLFADSIDFLEDASINILIVIALGWSARRRSQVGMLLALILLVPTAAALWTAWEKINAPTVPAPLPLSITGLGALAVNVTCAILLTRYRKVSGSLTRAAFLSARNDAMANIAIVVAGLVTVFWASIWPDLFVGLGIALINLGAAYEVFQAARRERKAAA